MKRQTTALLLCVGLTLLSAGGQADAVTIEIVVNDGPGEGFNDPTPVAPVGGNTGTTLGEQRLILFHAAAQQWGDMLGNIGASPVIQVTAQFDPQECTAESGVLGSAGALWIDRDFTNAPEAATWYSGALANALAGGDQDPGATEINATFNSNVDDDPICLGGAGWYYGLDGNPGSQIHLFPVLLHELAHGLGFQTFASTSSGTWCCGGDRNPDAYGRLIYDVTAGMQWPDMTNSERAASAINTDNVVFTGAAVGAYASTFMDGQELLRVTSGTALGDYLGIAAAFGGAITETGVTGDLELVNDGSADPTFACTSLVGFTAGNIALIDRGGCEFGLKCLNAQNAGATACVIANNDLGYVFMGGGVDGGSVTIPAMNILQTDRVAIVAGGLPVSSIVRRDTSVGRAAIHPTDGRILLYTPAPLEPGSSVSHFSTAATPNLLMEPAINPDLWKDPDLTIYEMKDIGWPLNYIFHDQFEWGDTRRWTATVP